MRRGTVLGTPPGRDRSARGASGERMRVLASAAAAERVREGGGRLWVWAESHRCCSGDTTLLSTSLEEPRRGGRFAVVPAEGFELHFDPGRLAPPDELHVELGGWRRRRVRAYWNGCAFAI
jgi:hypothetical protein